VGLLRDIQEKVNDPSVDLPTVLRDCLRLAYKLDNSQFKEWVEHELDGYPEHEPLPNYRVLRSYPMATARNSAWILSNTQVPLSAIPEEYRELATTQRFLQGIGYLKSLPDNGEAKFFWQADLVQLVNRNVNSNLPITEAYILAPPGFFGGMLDAIRNRILRFVLEIERENPEADQVPSGGAPIPQERVNQILINVFGGQVGIAGNNTFQAIQAQINPGDFDSLRRFLLDKGLVEADIKALEEALEENPDSQDLQNGKGKVAEWARSAGEKILGVGIDVGTQIAVSAAKSFMGIQ
jgi:hypothetical protein